MNLETTLSPSSSLASAGGVELAHLTPFELGPLLVEPALRRIAGIAGEKRIIQPLAMKVLLTLSEAQGEPCSRDDLVTSCWSQRIVSDDAVHRVISTLRRDLADLSSGSVAIETIAKVGYRLLVRVAPLRADDRGVAAPATSGKIGGRRFSATLLFAGLAAAGLFAATQATADVTAIAVVPEAGAEIGETARFASGLTGDLARLAGAMPTLAFVEPGGAAAGEPLLLRVALDAGGQIPTARLRLVDQKRGTVVWSREFAAKGGTLAALRELVANGVAGVVQCGLDRSAAFDDPVGLRLYLGACEGLETGDFSRARAFAQQITEFRPDVPAGWACLANSTIFAEAEKGPVSNAVLARAEGYARRALKVDPKSGLAYVALGMTRSWRGKSPLEILERGIRADPDFAMLHKHYAMALSAAGMSSKAVDPALRAVALHPHDPNHYRLAVSVLLNAGRIEEALALSAKLQRLWRYDRGVEKQRLEALFYARDAKTALATAAASPLREEPDVAATYETLVWRADPAAYDWSNFDRVAQQMYADNPSTAWRLSTNAARMGDQARALAWLERAPHDTFHVWAIFAPQAAALRRDARFFAKMASVGMVARWQESGRWPDFCQEPGLAYDCRKSAVRIAQSSSPGR